MIKKINYIPEKPRIKTWKDNTLMVGTSFQKILPLNSENINAPLNDKQSILQIKEVADKEDKNAEIKEIQFSPDKRHFAATDNMGRIGLFRLEGVVWSLVARYQFKGNINILNLPEFFFPYEFLR